MKRLLLVALLTTPAVFAQTPAVLDDPALAARYQATITPAELAGHLYVYASDHFEGRETATRGQRLAALYLAGQHQAMGLAPKGTAEATGPHDPRVYLQPYELDRQVVRRANLTAARGTQSLIASAYGTDGLDGQSYYVFGDADETAGDVIFAGHGVQAEGYDDFAAMADAGIDFAGKWLLFLDAEPMTPDGRSLITDDGTLTDYARNAFQKMRTATQTALPAGFLLIGDTDPRGAQPVAVRAEARLQRMGSLSLPGSERGGRSFPPVYVVSSAFADALLATADQTALGLREAIAASRAPRVMELPGVTLTSSVERGTETVVAENVAAFIEGSDPMLRDEVVILSAHLDHIGMDPTAEGDGLNNGADDDGSGTVALLEIAEAFQQAVADGHGPRRSLLFLHVSGEEKGLLGSAYYADTEPLVPLENTVANLNVDMIGRHDPTHPGADPNYVYIIGAELISQDLDDANAAVNTALGLGLDLHKRFNSPDDPEQFFRRSDHWNFGKHQIPFIFYFTGTHEDYHGVADHADKIDYDRMARIAQLIFGTAWQLANQDARPAVSGTGFN